ncbi:MAG: MarR family winged helix-turn-helix transcriptional regulator [Hyphomonas sp.]|jgi:DNA-binding MarR family transcriptional regulator|nr:MarR family winged helix-turn-helix transcriptional regulator [Hyphomonas sp.]
MIDDLPDIVRRMQQECFHLHTSMAARAIARHYEAAVKPVGLNGVQLSLLAALSVVPDASIGKLADRLAYERTTLTRNLKLLVRRGLIEPRAGGDRAVHHHLTDEGRARLAAAVPLWEQAQAQMASRLTSLDWTDLRRGLRDLRRPPDRKPA